MWDFVEYLRAYRAYVSANLGWSKALTVALAWLAAMFAPLAAKMLVERTATSAVELRLAHPGQQQKQ